VSFKESREGSYNRAFRFLALLVLRITELDQYNPRADAEFYVSVWKSALEGSLSAFAAFRAPFVRRHSAIHSGVEPDLKVSKTRPESPRSSGAQSREGSVEHRQECLYSSHHHESIPNRIEAQYQVPRKLKGRLFSKSPYSKQLVARRRGSPNSTHPYAVSA
jgi:hypothetical protein